jgi:osmotically-inducible protein OsmY
VSTTAVAAPERVAGLGSRVAACLVAAALVAGCATVRDPWGDVRIESDVKARLVAEQSASLTRLGVVSRQAVVYLSGVVAAPEDRVLAETLARGTGGVRRVVSTLEVRPPGAPEGPTPGPSPPTR